MKSLKQILREELEKYSNEIIVYHGTSNEHNFDDRGRIYNGTFFSTNQNEAKAYGKYVYKVELKPNIKIFDTNNLNDLKILMNEFGVLYDDYFSEDEDEHYIKTVEQLYNHSDNWNPIERTDGVLDWLNGTYDGIWIYEGGVRNLLLFNPIKEKIKSITKIS